MSWDPARYERFKAERRQPFHDLMALVEPQPDMLVLDLGCGTGELTRVLHDHLNARHTLGVDNSSEMLARSAEHVLENLAFEHGDLGEIRISPARDLVFSNAALHWLEDHESLLAHVSANVAPEGQLAVQVPANHEQPSHVLANTVAAEAPFASVLSGYQRKSPVLRPIDYDNILRELGYTERHVRLQIYGHELPSLDDVVTWVSGSLMTAYEARMSPPMYQRYLQDYRRKLHQEIGQAKPFYYQYRRILMWGRKG